MRQNAAVAIVTACWADEVTEIVARGFGPGLPQEGASVLLRIVGESLYLEGWPEVSEVRKAALSIRQQGAGLLLEWESPAGRCALSLDQKVGAGGAALLAWLPAGTRRQDAVTRRWLWAILLLTLGLPLLILALLFAFRGQIVDGAVAWIPVAQEQALADELWKIQRRQLKLIEGTAANRFVSELGERLVAAKATPYTYRFHLANDSSVNAFAMPAGYVVVHRGLIEKTATADEVAGVLAHEIEHVEQRHSLRGMVQALGFHAVWLVLTGDIGGGVAGEGVRQLAGLHFSREQESAADAGAYQRLVAAKIDPRGLASFFTALANDQAALPELLSSHPASAERAARLKGLLQDAPIFPPLTTDWTSIQSSLTASGE